MEVNRNMAIVAGMLLLVLVFVMFFRDSGEIVFEDPKGVNVEWQSRENDGGTGHNRSEGGVPGGAIEDAGNGETEVVAEIAVHVAGNVRAPGVYLVPEGTRLDTVLEMAGVIDMQIVDRHFNRAGRLADGQKIYIPTAGEVAEMMAAAESPEQLPSFSEWNTTDSQSQQNPGPEQNSGKININRASLNELMQLPGIGEVRGADIIRYRENHGQFKTINDIMSVTGIGQATFDRIKELITV